MPENIKNAIVLSVFSKEEKMSVILIILFTFALFSVLGVLGLGLFSMARGGDFSLKYGNKLMQLRIVVQAFAIVIFVILLFLIKN